MRHEHFQGPQTFKGIHRGNFLRAKRICTKDDEYQENMTKPVEKFIARGHCREVVQRVGLNISRMPQENVIQ